MYISANLPERYGVFETVRKDNFPFNQTFSRYVELIAQIGTYHQLDIVDVIGFIEDGVMGDERLPDIPEGDTPVQFRFKTESEIIQKYYESQEMTNRQITLLIIMMTLRLSERYGTSLYRIYAKIEEVSGLSGNQTAVTQKPKVKKPVVKKPKPKVTIKKKKRIVPEEVIEEEVIEEVIEEEIEDTPEEIEEDTPEKDTPEEEKEDNDDIVSRLQRLTQQGEQLLDTKDDKEDVVVETNPALGDFFPTD